MHHRNLVACRERTDLFYPAVEEKIISDEQCPDPRLGQALKSSIDFAVAASLQYLNLDTNGWSSRQHVPRYHLFNKRISWVLKKAYHSSGRYQFVQQRKRL